MKQDFWVLNDVAEDLKSEEVSQESLKSIVLNLFNRLYEAEQKIQELTKSINSQEKKQHSDHRRICRALDRLSTDDRSGGLRGLE